MWVVLGKLPYQWLLTKQAGNVSRGVEDSSLTLNAKLGTLQDDYIPQARKVKGLGFKV